MDAAEILRLLAVAPNDRSGCIDLLHGSADQTASADASAALLERLGSFSLEPSSAVTTDAMAWLTAFLRLTPTIVSWHRALRVPSTITQATLADVGRNIAIHRRVHGQFGLETWDWLIPHYTGMMFAIGRLNFMLQRTPETVHGVKLPGGWALGIHIPQSGPLTPEAVDSSLLHARTFFARHFPDKSAPVAVCASWLLDPYLTDHLPQNANIVAFAGRFTPLAPPCDDATAALFFVFRTRDVHLLATLPRRTTLQRLVVDRAQNNELWQIGTGYMML